MMSLSPVLDVRWQSVLGFLLVAAAFLAVFTEDFSFVLSECKSG